MPRYFFHVVDGHELPDETGTELPGLAEARHQAVHTAGQLLRDSGDDLWSGHDWRMHVIDERGEELFVLRVSARQSVQAA